MGKISAGAKMNQDEFYEKIPEWINQDKSRWNHITLMAYFCHKYMEKNGVRFRLVRWKEDPGKGKESRDMAKLFKTFAPENWESLSKNDKDAEKLKIIMKIYNYINWMFDYKFRSGDRSVTGTQLFLMPSIINEFERMYSKYLATNNGTAKMKELILWAKENVPEIFGLHELEEKRDVQMIEKYAELYHLDDLSPEKVLIQKAKEMKIL